MREGETELNKISAEGLGCLGLQRDAATHQWNRKLPTRPADRISPLRPQRPHKGSTSSAHRHVSERAAPASQRCGKVFEMLTMNSSKSISVLPSASARAKIPSI
jgi:hypothetical protein